VRAVLTQEVVTVHGTTPMREAEQMFLEYRWLGMLAPGAGTLSFGIVFALQYSGSLPKSD
jgi:hypothetical protein